MHIRKAIALGAIAVTLGNQATLIALASNQTRTLHQFQPTPELVDPVTSNGMEGNLETVVKDGKVFETKTPESIGKVELEEIKKALQAIDGLLEQSDRVVAKEDSNSAAEVTTLNAKVDIPKNPEAPVVLESKGVELEITLPKVENAQQGEQVANGVVAYASESSFANTVQATEDGSVRMTTIIDDPSAPTEYEYEVTLPKGGYIELLEDGDAAVLDSEGKGVKYIQIPWAKDAEGKDLKTWFTTDGLTLTQHVEHNVKGVVYPVTADPWWTGSCSQYLRYSNRTWWAGRMKINARPTNCGYAFSGGNNLFTSYHEALSKAGTWASGHDYLSMLYQWECHTVWRIQSEWNVEAARRIMSNQVEQLAWQCNPPL